ncbi:MAG: hypothetical protein WC785_08265 [Tatlockia sp.]
MNRIQFGETRAYTSARFEKDSRYYVIRLSKDLLDDWVIVLINGRIKSRLGQSRTIAFSNFSEGFNHFCSLAKTRYLRGYQLKTFACDNQLMLQLLPFVTHCEERHNKSAAKIKTVSDRNPSLKKGPKPPTLQAKLQPQSSPQQSSFVF